MSYYHKLRYMLLGMIWLQLEPTIPLIPSRRKFSMNPWLITISLSLLKVSTETLLQKEKKMSRDTSQDGIENCPYFTETLIHLVMVHVGHIELTPNRLNMLLTTHSGAR